MAVVPIGPTARIEAPAGMSEAELAFWREVVSSVSADHFRPADAPLLKAYCQHRRIVDEAIARMDELGMIGVGGNGTDVVSPYYAIVERSTKLLASLARCLRLAASSRVSKDKAERTTRPIARPWEYGSAGR